MCTSAQYEAILAEHHTAYLEDRAEAADEMTDAINDIHEAKRWGVDPECLDKILGNLNELTKTVRGNNQSMLEYIIAEVTDLQTEMKRRAGKVESELLAAIEKLEAA